MSSWAYVAGAGAASNAGYAAPLAVPAGLMEETKGDARQERKQDVRDHLERAMITS